MPPVDGKFHVPEYEGPSLELLYLPDKPSAQIIADVICVPGLGGHHIGTWQADDEPRNVWPQNPKSLASYVNDIRVLSFKYNTSLNGTTSQGGIRDHAQQLVTCLRDQREDEELSSIRPLVFVGHSLGGMIIKAALRKMAFDTRYQHLWDASRGVMFFATPHSGLDEKTWERFVYRVLLGQAPARGVLPSREMLRDLRVNCRMLSTVTQDFKPLHPELSFVTFIEDTPMEGLEEVLVNEVYGFTGADSEEPQKLSGDHLQICKFPASGLDESADFVHVYTGIQSLIASQVKAIHQLTNLAKRALYSLSPSPKLLRSQHLKPTEGTCEWIEKVPEVEKWLANEPGQQKLWVNGHEGSGKSVLTQYIVSRLNRDKTTTQRDAMFCSLDDNDPDQMDDLEFLLRVLLYQALHRVPAAEVVSAALLPTFKEAQGRKDGSAEIWTRDTLTQIWPDTVAEVMARCPIALVLDGLDRMAPASLDVFFECLSQLPRKSQEAFSRLDNKDGRTQPQARIIVLSRANDHIRGRLEQFEFNSYTIRPDDTKEDVQKTVAATLQPALRPRRQGVNPQAEEISRKVAESAGGSYQWATLAVDEVRQQRKTNSEEILSLLSKYPPGDVRGFYDQTFTQMKKNTANVAFIKQVLQWAVFQQEGLTVPEFRLAHALFEAVREHPNWEINSAALNGFAKPNIKAHTVFHCGQLVKFRSDGRLSLAHRGLKDYLTTPTNVSPSSEPNTASEFFLDPETSHAALARLCITYLTMPCFDLSTPSQLQSLNWSANIRSRLQDHPFLRYASLYWCKHIALAGSAWPAAGQEGVETASQTNEIRKRKAWLEDENSGYSRCWTEVWWYVVHAGSNEYPTEGAGELARNVVANVNSNVKMSKMRAAAAKAEETTQTPVPVERVVVEKVVKKVVEKPVYERVTIEKPVFEKVIEVSYVDRMVEESVTPRVRRGYFKRVKKAIGNLVTTVAGKEDY